MTSKMEPLHDKAESSSDTEGGLAIRQTKVKSTIPHHVAVLDGPESPHASGMSGSESGTSPPASPRSTSSVSRMRDLEKPTLGSPFHSPKIAPSNGLSRTSLDEGKLGDGALGTCVSILDTPARDTNAGSQPTEATEVVDVVQKDADLEASTGDDHNDTSSAGHIAEDPTATKVLTHTDPKNVNTSDGDVEVDSSRAHDETLVTKETDNATTTEDDEVAVTDGEDTNPAVTEESQPKQSVPPHLRRGFQSPAIPPAGPKYHLTPGNRFADRPRFQPRHPAPDAYPRYRPDGGPEESARMGAQLMKKQNELDAERKKSAGMRKAIEEEKDKAMETALAGMTMDLAKKQAAMHAREAKLGAKERDLQFREARIEQLEVFLSEGQKYLYRQYFGDHSGLDMTDINHEHDLRQAQLKAKKDIEDMKDKLMVDRQDVQLREASLQMREQQYRAVLRSSFEAEKREAATLSLEAELEEVADVEYNRGFGAGKLAGRQEAEKEVRQQAFLEGYSACRRAGVILSKVEHGLIAPNSPEAEFLFKAAHPENPFTMGTKIGAMGVSKAEKNVTNGVHHGQTEGIKKPVEEQKKAEKPAQEQKKAEEPFQEQKKAEEPSRRLPPPRPTFASELRGAQRMHNGHYVLANDVNSYQPLSAPNVNGVDGGATTNGGSEETSQDKGMVQDEKAKEGNLIDLN